MIEDDPVQGPPVSPEFLRRKRQEQEQEFTRIERIGDDGFLQDMRAYAAEQLRLWNGVPCKGLLEHVADCSDAFAQTCELAQRPSCARRQLAVALEERARERAKLRMTLFGWGVSPLVLSAVYDAEPLETEALKLLRAAWRQPENKRPGFIILSGGIGCGKTCAATIWAIENRARFITAPELAKVSPYDGEGDWIQQAAALVVDDLGTEYLDGKGFFLANFDALVNHRYSHRLPTVITTNLKVDEFRRYGVRVVDRIREVGVFLSVNAPSMRRKP
jgi:DNA replication protein DnaC